MIPLGIEWSENNLNDRVRVDQVPFSFGYFMDIIKFEGNFEKSGSFIRQQKFSVKSSQLISSLRVRKSLNSIDFVQARFLCRITMKLILTMETFITLFAA